MYGPILESDNLDPAVLETLDQQLKDVALAYYRSGYVLSELGAAQARFDQTLYRALGKDRYEKDYLPLEASHLANLEAAGFEAKTPLAEGERAAVTSLIQKHQAYSRASLNAAVTVTSRADPIHGAPAILDHRRNQLQRLESASRAALIEAAAADHQLSPATVEALRAHFTRALEEQRAMVADAADRARGRDDPTYRPKDNP